MLKVCIDTNVWISGIIFSGKPAEVVTAAFNRKFHLILSQVILDEVERNLLTKFKFSRGNVKKYMNRILQCSGLYEPTGSVKVIRGEHMDNWVLETAILGRAKYLITGDISTKIPNQAPNPSKWGGTHNRDTPGRVATRNS